LWPDNTYNLKLMRGLAEFDVRRRFVGSFVYELPFGTSKRWLNQGALSYIVGGWNVGGIPKCRCRPSPYLNNIIEQDHRFVKKRIMASQGFRSVDGALSTIAGYEAMNIIRKGQIRWLPKGEVLGQKRFIERLFGIAA
jgi:hypothetical protein